MKIYNRFEFARILFSARRRTQAASASALGTLASVFLFIVSTAGHAIEQPLTSAVPIDPISGILEAFKTHDVVALGEGNHNNEQGHAFRLKLIRDPRFAKSVDDIVVESGNSLYQEVMDRFTRGEDVPYNELRRVWQDTTVSNTVWDVPIYEEFFRAVRELNSRLPKRRQLRVLLGDPPIDWSQISAREEWLTFLNQRDSYPAGVIEREVVAKRRKALVIYGDGHFMRKNIFWNISNKALAEERFNRPYNSLVVRLERSGMRVFSVHTNTQADLTAIQPDIAGWQAPKLAIIAGTVLDRFSPWETYIMVDPAKGIEEKAHADPERSPTMGDQYNAILYLGPPSSITLSKVLPALCADEGYRKMRSQRAIVTSLPALAAQAGSFLDRYCAELPKQ